MSHRQYFGAREDALIQKLLGMSWSSMAYIGASYGLQPIRLSENGLVYAFEPVGCVFDALTDHVIRNDVVNVIPLRLGLSSRAGVIEIVHSGHLGHTPTVLGHRGRMDRLEKILCVDLNHPIFSIVDSMFVDIEGLEYAVFVEGPVVPNSIKLLAMEMHNQAYKPGQRAAIYNVLATQGFTSTDIGTRNEQDHVLFSRA
jgi:FkbM family methyltransferase